jgi:hypothetical protein
MNVVGIVTCTHTCDANFVPHDFIELLLVTRVKICCCKGFSRFGALPLINMHSTAEQRDWGWPFIPNRSNRPTLPIMLT